LSQGLHFLLRTESSASARESAAKLPNSTIIPLPNQTTFLSPALMNPERQPGTLTHLFPGEQETGNRKQETSSVPPPVHVPKNVARVHVSTSPHGV